ncbi:MAG: DUF927 domain-containing protein [Acutalibacteraceae bacterium]|nr:DUF927 domain-containing protein [Acutalibacteraceae bacterium]
MIDLQTIYDSPEKLKECSQYDLLSHEFLKAVNNIPDPAERTRVRTAIICAAEEKGIGKDIKKIFNETDKAKAKANAEYLDSIKNQTDFSFLDKQLDCGRWVANNDGICTINKDGVCRYASKMPFAPIALLENDSSGIEKVMLVFSKDGIHKRTIICDRNTVASASKIVTLANKGLEVTSENAKLQVAYISDVITENIKTIDVFKAYSQLGWCSAGFVPYASDAVFDGEESNHHLYRAVSEKGDFGTWKNAMMSLRENEQIRLTMAVSFASVLIEKVNGLPFVFHLYGGTGTGKTVALKCAMSIWGNPGMGKLVRTMNMTSNSMLSTAAFLNNLPFAGDELQTIKSRFNDYDQLIMQITEGINRGRMTYDKMEETKTWNCAFLFTGEEPCTHVGSGGGVKNRVIEIEVTSPLFEAQRGNETTSIVENNYGHAGKKFIEYISKLDSSYLVKRFRFLSSELTKEAGTTEKQASSMALILLADQLACACLFDDDDPITFDTATKYLINEDEVDVAERAYQWLISYISANKIRFLDTTQGNHGEIWGADRNDYLLFNAEILRNEMKKANYSFDAVKKKWAKKGYINRPDSKHLAENTSVWGSAKAPHIRIVLPKQEDVEDNTDYEEVQI